MGEWLEYIIKDIALTMADAPFGSNLKTKDYQSDGVLVIQGKNIQGRNCKWDDVRYVSREKYDSLKRHHAILGALIFPKVGTIGKVGYLTHPNDEKYFLLSTNTMMLEVDPDIALTDFVFYYFLSPHVQRNIQNMSSTSVQPVFNFTSLKHYPIFLPPLPEQKAIASVLSSLDDKIDLLHRQNKTLEAMAETLFRQWFVEEAEGSWESVKVGDFVKTNIEALSKGSYLPSIRYLDTGSLTEGRISGFQKLEIGNAPSRAKRIVRHNDVLISTVRPNQKHYGILKNPDERMIVSTGFCVITCEKIDPHFIYILLTSSKMTEYLHSIAEGSTSTYPSLKPIDIEKIEFQLPPKAKLFEFSEYAENTWGKIDTNQSHIDTLKELRDTLLPKLMSGVVSVSN